MPSRRIFTRHALTRQHHGLERAGELIHVEDLDALDLGQLVEVVVGGEDAGLHLLRQPDELGIDLRDVGEVALDDDESLVGLLQWRTVSRPLRPRARLPGSDESAMDCNSSRTKPGHDQIALEKAGADHVAYASVDYHRGIEDLGAHEMLRTRLLEQALEAQKTGHIGVALVAQVREKVTADRIRSGNR